MSSRFSEIAHDGMSLWNPLPEEPTLALVDGLDLAPGARVLDIGCGLATLLIRLAERTGAHGVGVDSWPNSIAAARAAAAGRVDPSRLELRHERFDPARLPAVSFDAAFCIGSTHACDGLRGTLRAIRALVRPGGTALVGEGHWLRDPDADYLALLGAEPTTYQSLEETSGVAREEGFDVVRVLVSSRDDFARYEERHAANVERFLATHPGDPDADAFRTRTRAWRAAYLRWGHDTLGFAVHVLARR